jgi:hypothetical protein
MKKFLIVLMVLCLTACGQPMHHQEKVYPTFGLLNAQTDQSKKMCYRVIWGNVVWAFILSETLVAPFYFIGFDLYEPYSVKTEKGCGLDAQ